MPFETDRNVIWLSIIYITSLKRISNRTLLSVIGHLYARLLDLLRRPRCDNIRLSVIKLIHSLIDHFDKKCKKGRSYGSALRASFILKILPGLAQGLLTSIVGEKGRNSVIKAVRIWAFCIFLEIFHCSSKIDGCLFWNQCLRVN